MKRPVIFGGSQGEQMGDLIISVETKVSCMVEDMRTRCWGKIHGKTVPIDPWVPFS